MLEKYTQIEQINVIWNKKQKKRKKFNFQIKRINMRNKDEFCIFKYLNIQCYECITYRHRPHRHRRIHLHHRHHHHQHLHLRGNLRLFYVKRTVSKGENEFRPISIRRFTWILLKLKCEVQSKQKSKSKPKGVRSQKALKTRLVMCKKNGWNKIPNPKMSSSSSSSAATAAAAGAAADATSTTAGAGVTAACFNAALVFVARLSSNDTEIEQFVRIKFSLSHARNY